MDAIKHLNITKSRAEWLPPFIKFITQIIISIWALLTLPFYIEIPDGIKQFFSTIYNGNKDEFIFDGSNENSYYNQITKNIPLEYFKNQSIVDLGCGNGSFYFWLKKQNIYVKEYYGIDFAFENVVLSKDALIRNISISEYFEATIPSGSIYFLSNSLCYISDEIFQSILLKLTTEDKIILIDPYPNLFWDSHFNGIKPTYRTINDVYKLFEEYNFIISKCSIDYVINIKNIHLSPISYCLYAKKSKVNLTQEKENRLA